MKVKAVVLKVLDNLESYICQVLLSFFISLLFLQILLRELFELNISWGEELARFCFVWFVFFGASFAARLAAHNRVTFQFRWLPKKAENYILAFADFLWVVFNGVIIYKAVGLIVSMFEYPYISPTLGWSMAYVYLVFPLAFLAMTIRIIQVNYLRLIKGVEIQDPDKVDAVVEMNIAEEAEGEAAEEPLVPRPEDREGRS